MEVPILKQGAVLIATFQAALSDADLNQLRMGLVQQVVKFRSRAVIVDVTAMDVMDSFASRTLREIALMIRLRGAETVIVGIQPEVALQWCNWAKPWNALRPRWIWKKVWRT